MTTQTELRLLTALRGMHALQKMETGHIKKLAALASEMQFAKDQIIYRSGDPGEAIYFIEEGEVVIEMTQPDNSNPMLMYTVGPGHLFGWSALFPTRRKQARARAVTPTRVIAINAAGLRAAFRSDQSLENAMIQQVNEVIADRLAAIRQQLANTVQLEAKVQ
jgi:SulP family sulfate permease